MEGEEGSQQPHLVLAHHLFLLKHPNVPDIEKVRLKDEVLASIRSDGEFSLPPLIGFAVSLVFRGFLSFRADGFSWVSDMASLYETLAAESLVEMDRGLLDSMRARIDEETKKLDEK